MIPTQRPSPGRVQKTLSSSYKPYPEISNLPTFNETKQPDLGAKSNYLLPKKQRNVRLRLRQLSKRDIFDSLRFLSEIIVSDGLKWLSSDILG